MRVAIATSDEQKEWYGDIELLIESLKQDGVASESVIWDKSGIDWASYNVVLIDSTWNYTEKPQAFLKWCESVSVTSKLVNSLEIIKLSSSKRYLVTLGSAGLNIPITDILETHDTVSNRILSTYGDKVVIKPLVGASGVDTFLYDNIQSAVQISEVNNLLAKEAVIIQSYVHEIETLGEFGAVFIGGQLSHCVLKKPAANDFRVQYQYGGITTLVDAPKYTQELYEQVVSALNVNPLYMRLDFIPTNNPTIMEVEMVEPNKYLSLYPKSAELLAKAITG